MSRYSHTNRSLLLSHYFGPIPRYVRLPKGTRVVWTDMGPSGFRWTVDQPTRFAGPDEILRHDLEHHYLVVPNSSVDAQDAPGDEQASTGPKGAQVPISSPDASQGHPEPSQTDYAHDEAQDMRAVGPDREQEARGAELA